MKAVKGVRVSVLGTEEEVNQVLGHWNDLAAETPNTDLFSISDWYTVWWKHFGRDRPQSTILVSRWDENYLAIRGNDPRPYVVVVRDTVGISAILPLMRLKGTWRKCPVRILVPCLNGQSPRSGMIFLREPETAVGRTR